MFQLQRYRSILLYCSIFMCIFLVLAGCSSAPKEESPVSSPSEASQAPTTLQTQEAAKPVDEEETRIFSTIKGDITIPANPKRIVTQGLLPYLIAFDVKPVGAPAWEIEYPHLAGKTDGIEDIGLIEASSLEKIIDLQPDLIVTVAEEMYDQLSMIAPTVVIPYDVIGDAHKDMRLFGELLGKEQKAEEWLAIFDQKVAEGREKINQVISPNDTFTTVGAFDKTYYIYGEGIYRGGLAIYKYLGLQPSPLVKQHLFDENKQLLEVSFEVIPEYVGTHIFLDEANGGSLDQTSSVWQGIEAVKNKKVYPLNIDIFWPYDPLAIMMQMDELFKMLGADKQ